MFFRKVSGFGACLTDFILSLELPSIAGQAGLMGGEIVPTALGEMAL